MGTHISRVRSLTLDNWDAGSVSLMGSIGNTKANSYFENKLPAHLKIGPGADDQQRGEFIKAKYANRQWYAPPDAGTAAAAAGGTANGAANAAAPPQLSKMEQRQQRLAQKAAVLVTQPAAAIAQPVQQRAVSVPSTFSASAQPNLFSGMNVSSPPPQIMSPAAAAYASQASTSMHQSSAAPINNKPAPAHVPVPEKKAVPARTHSASPWVSRSEHQPQQQQAFVAAPVAQQTTSNLLDLSFVSDVPAAHPAAGHAMDDLFAGMSVAEPSQHQQQQAHHPHVNVNTSGAGAGAPSAASSSADLLSYYSTEPASAPARSQHTNGGDMFGFATTMNDAAATAAPPAASSSESSFSFLSESSSSSSEQADPLTGVGGNASFAGGDSSAFSFLGGESSDAPPPAIDGSDFGNLLGPAAAATFPLPGNGLLLPAMVGGGVGGLSPAFPLMHSGANPSVPFMAPLGGGVGNAFGAPPAFAQPAGDLFGAAQPQQYQQQQQQQQQYQQQYQQPLQQAFQQQQSMHFQSAVPQQGGGGAFGFMSVSDSSGGLAPLPPFAGSMNNAPGPTQPIFSVQSVGAAQRAQQAAAQAHADDPFAHISASASPPPSLGGGGGQQSSSPPQGGFGGASPKPKQPHECDADGCTNKKVSRGLCSMHLRTGGVVAAPPQQFQQAGAIDSSFAFLASSQPPAAAPQQADSFSFLAQPAAPAEQSGFSFLS